MIGNVFTFWVPGINQKTGFQNYAHVECEYDSVEEIVARLNEGRIVSGSALFTKAGAERGEYEVIDRKPWAVGRHGVARIEIPRARFVEYEAEQA